MSKLSIVGLVAFYLRSHSNVPVSTALALRQRGILCLSSGVLLSSEHLATAQRFFVWRLALGNASSHEAVRSKGSYPLHGSLRAVSTHPAEGGNEMVMLASSL